MKTILALLILSLGLLILFGSPLDQPAKAHYYGSPETILPMNFAHIDHQATNCVDCHHNYVDDTGNGLCMGCHVSDAELFAELEDQFHTLCRDCHVEEDITGQPTGPTRQCTDCHIEDDQP